eukprot:Selendium_serpulae@DN8003_c0_g1_i1.p1
MWFNVSDRQKLETTSSYICPEIAALVIQNDVMRGKTNNHFAATLSWDASRENETSQTRSDTNPENLDKEWEECVRPYLEDTFVMHHRLISNGRAHVLCVDT